MVLYVNTKSGWYKPMDCHHPRPTTTYLFSHFSFLGYWIRAIHFDERLPLRQQHQSFTVLSLFFFLLFSTLKTRCLVVSLNDTGTCTHADSIWKWNQNSNRCFFYSSEKKKEVKRKIGNKNWKSIVNEDEIDKKTLPWCNKKRNFLFLRVVLPARWDEPFGT